MLKFLPILLLLSNLVLANHHEENMIEQEAAPLVTELPTFYSDFVEIIGLVTADEIIAILGEPAKKNWYTHEVNQWCDC